MSVKVVSGNPELLEESARKVTEKATRILVRSDIAKLMRRSWSISDIANKLKMTEYEIQKEWKVIVKQVRQDQDEDVKGKVALVLEELREIKREAWESWERSKLDFIRKLDEDSDSSKFSRRKSATTRETKNPGNEYLKTIIQCIDKECELQALNPAKQIDLKQTINWDILSLGLPEGDVPDVVEEEIRRIMLGYGSTNSSSSLPPKSFTNSSSTPIHESIMLPPESVTSRVVGSCNHDSMFVSAEVDEQYDPVTETVSIPGVDSNNGDSNDETALHSLFNDGDSISSSDNDSDREDNVSEVVEIPRKLANKKKGNTFKKGARQARRKAKLSSYEG